MAVLEWRKTKQILKEYNVPLLETKVCQTKKEAEAFAQTVGYPIVLKISSLDILHKTDVSGVRTGINDARELRRAWDEMISQISSQNPMAKIDGFFVQKQLKGFEVAIGMKRDLQFGPVIMFGLGGIFLEVLKDATFHVAPVSRAEAKRMIRDVRIYKILKGFRGQEAMDINGLVSIIEALSKLSIENLDIKQIDLNPVIVNPGNALIVDAKIIE